MFDKPRLGSRLFGDFCFFKKLLLNKPFPTCSKLSNSKDLLKFFILKASHDATCVPKSWAKVLQD